MLTKNKSRRTTNRRPMYVAMVASALRPCALVELAKTARRDSRLSYNDPRGLSTTNVMTIALELSAIVLTLPPSNVEAFCRRTISLRRGWRHFPGVCPSTLGEALGVEGVVAEAIAHAAKAWNNQRIVQILQAQTVSVVAQPEK